MDLMSIRRGLLAQMASGKYPGWVTKMAAGTVQIDSTQTIIIPVEHNLGKIPKVAAIWADVPVIDKQPYGSCVYCLYFLEADMIVAGAFLTSDKSGKYLFCYRHSTSGNYLTGSSNYNYPGQYPTDTTWNFVRGSEPWAITDTDGNPINYNWVCLCD